MQLIVNFNDELLSEYSNLGSALFFEIYFENDGKYYPSEHWMDFGEVILQWWVMQLSFYCKFQETPKLLFMEGYYCLEFDSTFASEIGDSSLKELTDLIKVAIITVINKKTELQLPVLELEASLNQLMTDCTF